MIEVQQLAKRFQQGSGRKARVIEAVRDLSFVAVDGRITGLLGPNGAGKTTTLRMVAALMAPDTGRIHVDGIDVASQPQAALANSSDRNKDPYALQGIALCRRVYRRYQAKPLHYVLKLSCAQCPYSNTSPNIKITNH